MSDAATTQNSLPSSAAPAVKPGRRLAWLDALRGVAALFVVFDHLGYYVLQHAREVVYQWFDPGQYGVFVFFMVSGYIVPASLERKGSIRGFWVSRAFRLYPLYVTGLAGAVVLWKLGLGGIGRTNYDGETSLLTHALMLSNVLGPKNAINVIWTLSYEMAFYLLLTAVAVFVLAGAAGLWHVPAWDASPAAVHTAFNRQWITSLGLAGVTFAIGVACRNRKMPAIFAWLGLVSYSVYLLHPLLISLYNHLPLTQHPHPFPEQLALAGAFTVILLACCSLSYRFIEAPMQRQGRKFAAWLEYWFGPDSIPAHVEAQDSSRSADEAPAAHAGAAHAGAAHAGAAPDAHAPASSGAR